MDYDIIIIGGGPSGLMAGGAAACARKRARPDKPAKVLILEKNTEAGVKLSITGGGRCNVTNAEYDTRELLKHYGEAVKFLHSPFSQYGVEDTFKTFEKLGLPLVVEARKRAFPNTQKAPDVRDAMVRYAKGCGAELQLGVEVKRFVQNAEGTIIAVETTQGRFHAKEFILATGGLSAPETGSTGDGLEMLKTLGHTVHTPNPNLVPLKSDAPWVHRLAGVAPSFMTIRFKQNGTTHIKKTGKVLFTHFGLSGPLVINSSYEIKKLLQWGDVHAEIDLFPDTDHAALDARLLKLFDAHKNKQVKNVLDELLPNQLAIEILRLCGITLETPVHSVSKEQRKKLVHTLKALGVPIVDTMGMEKAIVADGGVELTEIDFKTMHSKVHPNLAITGDLLNVNRPSGGFSLQLCWTTGHVAGTAAAKALK